MLGRGMRENAWKRNGYHAVTSLMLAKTMSLLVNACVRYSSHAKAMWVSLTAAQSDGTLSSLFLQDASLARILCFPVQSYPRFSSSTSPPPLSEIV